MIYFLGRELRPAHLVGAPHPCTPDELSGQLVSEISPGSDTQSAPTTSRYSILPLSCNAIMLILLDHNFPVSILNHISEIINPKDCYCQVHQDKFCNEETEVKQKKIDENLAAGYQPINILQVRPRKQNRTGDLQSNARSQNSSLEDQKGSTQTPLPFMNYINQLLFFFF